MTGSTQLIYGFTKKVFPILFLMLTGCNDQSPSDREEARRIDSMKIDLGDSMRQYARHKSLDSMKAAWYKYFQDTAKLKTDTVARVFKTVDETEAYYRKIIAEKNTLLFAASRNAAACDKDKPDIAWLIAIVVITGVLGGIAGPRFNLLNDPDPAMQEVEAAVNNAQQQIDALRTRAQAHPALMQDRGMEDIMIQVEQAISGIKATADDVKKDRERKYAYIIFGVIAAALSFVALNLFNSKILDFKNTIDYFIFMGYCLVGAVFAKKWIMQIYDAISKKG